MSSVLLRFRNWSARQRGRRGSLARRLITEMGMRSARSCSNAVHVAAVAMPGVGARVREAIRLGIRSAGSRRPFVVIAVPHTLHYLIPCLRLLAAHGMTVVISNGLGAGERATLRKTFPAIHVVEVPSIPGVPVAHGRILELLLDSTDQDFVLHDPDLYVFRPSLYDELELQDGEIAVSAFGVTNEHAGLSFPTTHLVALRAEALRTLSDAESISPRVYRRTPRRLRDALGVIGVGDHRFPKPYLPYYDVLSLMWVVAIARGLRFRILSVAASDVFHVGGVSYDRDNPRLAYVHARFLALPTADALDDRYRSRFSGQDVLSGSRADPFFDEVDTGIALLTARLGECP